MPVARTRAVALVGVRGAMVDIEADLGAGIPGFSLIGLPDASLGEARDRVRSAARNSGCEIPNRRYTVNLSPASLPKHGAGFDLGIAMSMLAAAGVVDPDSVARVAHVGELGLDGRLRRVPGVLPMVLAARRAGCGAVMVPAACASEAGLVDGIDVVPVGSLRQAATHHRARLEDPGVQEPVDTEAAWTPQPQPAAEPDLADVVGNREAVEALVAAAAGGHHLFMVGPPGAGKTMLASRLPGLLPDLDLEAAIEAASIRSLSGAPVVELSRRPPFEAPHHTASPVAIIGGGSGVVRPGAIARAAHGVLFLDEAPEFSRVALDALRQPLEAGVITVHRANAVAEFPANVQLVLAANPCPCGQPDDDRCSCTPLARRRYLGRLSGPLLDRVDLRIRVHRMSAAGMRAAASGTSTAQALLRVLDARAAASERLQGTAWRRNADVPGPWLRQPPRRPPAAVVGSLDRALERGALTMRGYDRALRVAWTLCDLDGATSPRAEHIDRALALRAGAAA